MLNRIILIGRLANDPEAKYTPSGIAVTTFRIAVDRPMSAEARQQGQEKQTDFIDIVAWRQSAEFAANYLSKGRLVAVEGKLQIREYVTQDGQKRKSAEVVADNLKSLDKPRDPNAEGNGAEGGAAAAGGGYAAEQQRAGGGGSGGGGYQQRSAAPAAARTAAPAGRAGAPAARGGNNSFAGGGDDDDMSDLSDPFAE
jgi:single-strand DNA-binding protein